MAKPLEALETQLSHTTSSHTSSISRKYSSLYRYLSKEYAKLAKSYVITRL